MFDFKKYLNQKIDTSKVKSVMQRATKGVPKINIPKLNLTFPKNMPHLPEGALPKFGMNIAVTLFLLVSLRLSKLITLSILEQMEGIEMTKTKQYLFSVMFTFVWIISMSMIMLCIIIIYISLHKTSNNLLEQIQHVIQIILDYFKPEYVLLSVIGTIILLNLLLMFYYIETKDRDTIVFDTTEKEEDDSNGNEDENSGYDGSDDIDDDKDGIGFVYRLVEIIYKINFSMFLFIVWVVDFLRLCT